MNKKNKTPYKKAEDKVSAAQISGRNMAQSNHTQVPGDVDDYFVHKSIVEEEYEKYREQEEKWELFKEIASACVNKYPTTNDNDIAWVANTAVNLTNLLYSEWKR